MQIPTINYQVSVAETTEPVARRVSATRWAADVSYVQTGVTIFDSAGCAHRIEGLRGSIHIEVEAEEVFWLLEIQPGATFAPGEWEEKVLAAGLRKAAILAEPGALREAYVSQFGHLYAPPAPEGSRQ